MEFLLSVWQFYLAEPMFTVGFVLGNLFFCMLYLRQYANKKWSHHSWDTIMQLVLIALSVMALASAVWPVTIPLVFTWLIWKYPCYWIGKFITDRMPKRTLTED